MRRLGLALLLGLSTASIPLPARPSCKPTAPIDLEARLVGDPSSPFGISATATSRTGSEVELEILLPVGITHLSGDRKLKGRRCEARIDASVKDRTRREIFVRATTVEGGAVMTRVVSLLLFDGPLPARGTPGKNSRGEGILEFSP
ncbi:MAG: hypothetical protein HY293_06400 [Planctomycetes bacterium]|nr:hypothetical protein [Planctomycetota bacterium]